MKKPTTSDPLRAHYLELCEELAEHAKTMRDYGLTPVNSWLARGELQQIGQLLTELETLLEQIKQADEED